MGAKRGTVGPVAQPAISHKEVGFSRWREGKGGAQMRAELSAPLCKCRHSLRTDDQEALVEGALEHMRHNHPDASVEVERLRETISTRSYDIEYVVVYEGGYGPEAEFGVEPY